MAKKNNINITSNNTYISSKALKKAETPSGDNEKQKKDDKLNSAIKGGVDSISDSIKKTNDYLAVITGAVLGVQGITLNTDFETLKSRITNSESLTKIINNEFSNLKDSLKDNINNLSNVISQLKPLNTDESQSDFQKEVLNCLTGITKSLNNISNKPDNNVNKNVENKDNSTSDNLHLSPQDKILTYLSGIEAKVDNEEFKKNVLTHLESIVSKLSNNASNDNNNNVNGSVDIVIKGIDKDGINALTNLLNTNSTNATISNNIDYDNIINAIKKLNDVSNILSTANFSGFDTEIVNKISNFNNLIDIFNQLSGKVDKLDEVMSNILKIKDDTVLDAAMLLEKFSILGSVDFSGITNESIENFDKLNALINTLIGLDTGAIEDAFANVAELSFLSKPDYDWINQDTGQKLTILSYIVNGINNIINDFAKYVPQYFILSMFSEFIYDTFKLLAGDDKQEGLVKLIDTAINGLSSVQPDKVEQSIKIAERVNDLIDTVFVGSIQASLASISIKGTIKFLKKIGGKKDTLEEAINGLPDFTKDHAEKLENLKSCLDNVAKIAVLATITGVFAVPGAIGLGLTIVFLSLISKTINAINNFIDLKDLEADMKQLKAFSKLMVMIAGVTLFAAVVGTLVLKYFKTIFAFTVMLGTFMAFTILAIRISTMGINGAFENIESFCKLLIVSSALVLFGALLGGWLIENWRNVLAFTGMLAGFMAGTILAYRWSTKGIEDAFDVSEKFIKLLVISAGILLFGTVIFRLGGGIEMLKNAALFVFALGVFIYGIHWLYNKIGEKFKEDAKIATEFMDLVVASALVMSIGALLMKIDGFGWNALGFTLLLSGFIFVITGAYNLAAKGIKNAMIAADKFAVLVGISALVMSIGAFIINDEFIGKALWFTGLLAAFIGVITSVYNKASKNIKRALPTALALEVLILVSAFSLILAAKILTWDEILGAGLFALGLGLFLIVISSALFILSKIEKHLIKGMLAMVGIVAIIWLSAFAFKEIAVALDEFEDRDPWYAVTKFGAIMGALIVGVGVICAILTKFAGYVAIGEAVLLGIIGLIYLSGKALSVVAKSMDDVIEVSEKAKQFEVSNVTSLISGFLSIVTALSPLANPIVSITLGLASATLYGLSKAIGEMALTTQKIAALQIPIYTGTKITGYVRMQPKDFEAAAENAKTIITTLGRAIIEVYNANPDIFKTDIFGQSPFGDTVRACTGLGKMLSKISSGVKDYATMSVPIYGAGGKVVGRRKLTDQDFKDAARNVKRVITVLGKAIIETYDSNPEIFQTSGGIFGIGSKSKFTDVVNSCTGLGKMISNIAKGVEDYANFKIANDWDKTGKPISYTVPSDPQTIFDAAAKNIKSLISTLGNSIIAAYDENPELFETSGGIFGFGSQSKFTKVVKSYSALGGMISDISEAVEGYANFRVADGWDPKTGKPTSYKKIESPQTYFAEASDTIKQVMITLGSSIIAAYDEHPELFETTGGIFGFGAKSKFVTISKAYSALGGMMSNVSKGIQDYANLKIPVEWDADGKAIKFEKFDPNSFATSKTNIGDILKNLGDSIIKAYDENEKTIFGDGFLLGKEDKDSKFYKVSLASSNIAKMISNLSKNVQEFAELKIQDYRSDGTLIDGKYRVMNAQDFERAGSSVSKILTTVGVSMLNAFDNPKYERFFKDDSWFNKDAKNTPFAIMTACCAGMGNIISTNAKAIKDVADLKITNDKGEKITITETDITSAVKKSELIMTSLLLSFKNVYDNKDLKGILNSNKIATMKVATDNIGAVITGILASISKILSFKVGKHTLYTGMFAGKNPWVANLIKDIIGVLPNSVNPHIANYKTVAKELDDINDDIEEYTKFYTSIAGIFKSLSSVLTEDNRKIMTYINGTDYPLKNFINRVLYTFIGVNFRSAEDMKNINKAIVEYTNAFDSLASLYENLDLDILNNKKIKSTILALSGEDNILKKAINNVKTTFNGFDITVPNNLDENLQVYAKSIEKIEQIYDHVGNICNVIVENQYLKDNLNNLSSNIITPIMQLISTISIDSNTVKNLNTFISNEHTIKRCINTIANVYRLLDNIQEDNIFKLPLLSSSFVGGLSVFKKDDISFETIKSISDNYVLITDLINNILLLNNAIKDSGEMTHILNFPVIAQAYRDGIVTMGQAYYALSNIGGVTSSMFENMFTYLYGEEKNEQDIFSKALQGINNIISQITTDNIEKFAKQTKDVENFAKAINSIDLSKAQSLNNLIDSINLLANNMGNLDGLTEAIAVKLASVLERLTSELNSTKETFNKAERIQKARNEFIQKAITRVEDTMKNPILVRVGVDDEQNKNNTPSGTPNNSDKGTPGNSGGSGGSGGSTGLSLQDPPSYNSNNNQFRKENTPEPKSSNTKSKYNINGVKTSDETKNNFNNITSNIRSTMVSVFEEMIYKYNLDGNTARGNARPS